MNDVLIIGATSDIARAIARSLGEHGYGLYLTARDPSRLEKDAQDLTIRTGRAPQLLALDILDFEGHRIFWESLDPKPVGVVCAAGLLGDARQAQVDFSEARRILDTNLTGCVSLLDLAAEHFETTGKGFIIGVSSVAGDRGRASNYHYGAAKAAFTAYLSGLRNRLGKTDVRVITVKPGFVATRMTDGMDLPERLTAQPEEVAADVVKALRKGREVIYTKWYWRFIMLIVRHIPEAIFKRLSL